MSEINGSCTKEVLGKLAASCPVRAVVGGAEAIVRANSWSSVSEPGKSKEGYLVARAIRADVLDMQVKGTPLADADTQRLLEKEVVWEDWSN